MNVADPTAHVDARLPCYRVAVEDRLERVPELAVPGYRWVCACGARGRWHSQYWRMRRAYRLHARRTTRETT